MEVAAKEHFTKGKESVPVTASKEDADVCNHFTIRGYVAHARKRDAKICWPLFVPNSESPDMLANMLPPLHVSKFKRWSCLNCLHTVNTSADVTGNMDFLNVGKEEIKTNNSLFLLNANAKRLFSGSNQSSENIIPGERLVSDSSINIKNGDSPDPYHGKKENGSITEDVVKEGIQVCISGNFKSEENQDQSCKPTSAVAEDEEFIARESQTRKLSVYKSNSETALLCHDASLVVCAKPNGGASIGASDGVPVFRGTNLVAYGNKDDEGTTAKGKMNVMPDGMAKETMKMFGVDLGTPKDDALTANFINYNVMGLDQSNDEASYSNMDSSDGTNCRQNQNGMFSSSHGKVNHKKIRKLRFLEDIMKSQELHISKKAHTFKGDAEKCDKKNKHEGGLDGSRCEAQLGECKNNLVSQNSIVRPTYPINSLEANGNKDDELSLIHWLKKVPKKFVSDDSQKKKPLVAKGYAEIKHLEDKISIYPSRFIEKDVDALPEGSRVSKPNKNYTVEKENKVPRAKSDGDCLRIQQENLTSKDARMKHVHPGNVYSKLRSISSANIFPPLLGNLDRSSDKKAIFNRRKKKASQVVDRNSSQINWLKKEVIKKQRTTKTHKKETVDDIPMDIVELLAKNQHERSLMNGEIAIKKKHELSIMHGEMRHGNDSYFSEYYGSKISNAIHKSHVISNDSAYDIPTASHGNQNAEPEACKSVKCQKQIFIDLNQQATDFLTIPEYDGHQPYTTHIPADSQKIYSLKNSSWDRMRLPDLGSYQKDQGVSAPSSSRDTHHMLSPPLKGRIFGVNTRKIDTYCNYGKMVPHDSFVDKRQRTVARKTDSQKPMNLSGSHFLNGGGQSEQSTNRTTLLARSYLMEGGSMCHLGRTVPVDLHTNETVSALYLLRLVDQAALAGASWDINRVGITQDTVVNCDNQSSEMLGVKVGFKIRKTTENPSTAGYSAHDQNEGNSNKLHRPVPRVGALGSLLQEEIMTRSNIASLGSKARCSYELPSFCIDGIEKTDIPSSAIDTEYGSSNSCLSVTINSKQKTKAGESLVHKFEMDHVGISKKDEPVKSVRHDCITVNCIINQNPADFSLPDEDNVYMRGREELSSKYTFPPHQEKKHVSPQKFMASNSS